MRYQVVLVHQSLLLFLVLLFKANKYLLFLFVELANQLCEAVLNVRNLHFHKSLEFITDLGHENAIVVDEPFGTVQHLSQVNHVLLKTICHIFDGVERVTVVIIIDAFDAHARAACLTKVLDKLLWVLGTRDAVKGSHQEREGLFGCHEVDQLCVLAALVDVILFDGFTTERAANWLFIFDGCV